MRTPHGRKWLETLMPNGETLAQNIEDARLLLKIHGYISDSVSDKVKAKLEREWNQP